MNCVDCSGGAWKLFGLLGGEGGQSVEVRRLWRVDGWQSVEVRRFWRVDGWQSVGLRRLWRVHEWQC